MQQAQVQWDICIPVVDITSNDTFRFKREIKYNVRYNIDDLDYQNLLILKAVLDWNMVYCLYTKVFSCTIYIGCTIFSIKFTKESNLLLDPPEAPYCDVSYSFRSIYTELFQHIDMRKHNITFTGRNLLPVILPNQIFNTEERQ